MGLYIIFSQRGAVVKYITLLLLFNCITSFLNAQSPGGYNTGLSLWLKANTTTAANITYNATNNVAQWKSDVGTYSVAQATVSKRPFFYNTPAVFANFNFNPFISFDTVNNTFLGNSSVTPNLLNTAGTIIMVTNKYKSTSAPTVLSYYANSNYRFQIKPSFRVQNGVNGIGYKFDINTLSGTVINYPEESAFLLASLGAGAGSKARRNATDFGLPTGNVSTFFPAISSGLYIGSNNNVAFSNMSVAEVIMYNVQLSGQPLQKIESYLALKYGITLDEIVTQSTNYLASDGTVIWDKGSQLGYNENITGIGRDDASGLLQRQSKSVNKNALVTCYNNSTAGNFPPMNDSNNTVFNTDRNFLLFGDNNLDTGLTICAMNGFCNRMPRIWKVQKTGGTGLVTLAIPANLLSGVKKLLVSANASFPAAGTVVHSMQLSSQKYVSLQLNDNDFFTFASDSVALPQLDTVKVCFGANATATVNNPFPGAVYNWYSNSSGGTSVGSGINFTIPGLQNDTTLFVETITLNNCGLPGRIPVKFMVQQLNTPVATVTLQPNCVTQTGTIVINSFTVPHIGYSINGLNYFPLPVFNNLLPGTYPVSVKDTITGCVSSSINLTVNPVPAAPVLPVVLSPVTICMGNSVTFTVVNNQPGLQYNWYSSATGSIPIATGISFTSPVLNSAATYFVSAYDPLTLCSSAKQAVNVFLHVPLASPQLTTGLITPNSIQFSWNAVNGALGYMVSLDGINFISPGSGSNGLVHTVTGLTPLQTITFFVRALDSFILCKNSQSSVMATTLNAYADLYIPTVFTPNKDGTNDLFMAIGSVQEFDLKIFNRWGKMIFSSNNIFKGWDGSFKGIQQPTGTYVYMVKAVLPDGRIKKMKGTLLLVK